jgi:hypothetical protein
MARPWIEFIQSQNLPWQSAPLASLRGTVQCRVLSEDDASGASSLVVRYPAGWSHASQPLTCNEELLVIDGELQIDEQRYGPFSYAHFPAGYESGGWRSPTGTVAVHFLSARPSIAPAGQPYDARRLVLHVDGLAAPYTGNFHPEFPPGAGRKILFQDPETHDTTWLLGTMPLRWADRAEVHPTVEEMFLLAGEVHGNRGVMRPGAYFWRPGDRVHGPYGTKTGNLYLFRTQGGALSTRYVAAPRAFHWDPVYDPIVPKELEPFAREAPAGALPW